MDDNRIPRATGQPKLVSEMTFEQAEIKRASDRVHQRFSRARRQNKVAELERKNAALTSQLLHLENQLRELRKCQKAVQMTEDATDVDAPHSIASTTTNFTQGHEGEAQIKGRILLPRSSFSYEAPSIPTPNLDINYFPELPMELNPSLLADPENDFLTGDTISFKTFPEDDYFESLPWLLCDQFEQRSGVFSPVDRATRDGDTLDMERQLSFTLGTRISEWSQAEQLISVHLPPVTPTDHVLIEVSDFGRRWSQQKGQQYEELHLPNYPDLSSLLKPTSRDAASSPISSAIGKHSAWATSVHSLASRVAYHYMVAQMIRWMICRTQQSYNQLPPFLRPTELQRIVPHPAWVDVFFWPEGRDLIIKHMDYSKFDGFHHTTRSFSVNWPYRDEDIFLKDSTHHYLFLNPVFAAHIRDVRNWTFDPAVGEVFPFLKSCPTTVGR